MPEKEVKLTQSPHCQQAHDRADLPARREAGQLTYQENASPMDLNLL